MSKYCQCSKNHRYLLVAEGPQFFFGRYECDIAEPQAPCYSDAGQDDHSKATEVWGHLSASTEGHVKQAQD